MKQNGIADFVCTVRGFDFLSECLTEVLDRTIIEVIDVEWPILSI